MRTKKQAILLIGPPGSGKGTQADLVARAIGAIHFDTGSHIERMIASRKGSYKSDFNSGKLVDSAKVLRIVSDSVSMINKAGFSVVLSGSPRASEEAFGKDGESGVMGLLKSLYGKSNIAIFHINIAENISIRRNSKRRICEVCGRSNLLGGRVRKCPICGGSMRRRTLDSRDVIKARLVEYKSRTEPMIRELKKRGYKVNKINGTPKPSVVFSAIMSRIGKI